MQTFHCFIIIMFIITETLKLNLPKQTGYDIKREIFDLETPDKDLISFCHKIMYEQTAAGTDEPDS